MSLTYDAESAGNRRVGGLDPSPQITEDLVSEDLPQVRVTIAYDGKELQLTLDEHLTITGVKRGRP